MLEDRTVRDLELDTRTASRLDSLGADVVICGRVTDIARSMVTRYGMSDILGGVAYERDPGNFLAGADRPYPVRERDYAEETAAAVDREVKSIVDQVFQRTQGILTTRRPILDRAAKKLLEKETLEQSDIDGLIREMPKEGLRAI